MSDTQNQNPEKTSEASVEVTPVTPAAEGSSSHPRHERS